MNASARTEIRRRRERAAGPDTVLAVLQEGLLAHVGITTDHGPVVIPMTYGLSGTTLYLHGSPASRLLRALGDAIPVCVTVTLLDGLVLARSAFHHSMNYRSAVVFGTARVVHDDDEKAAAFDAIVDHVVPGRRAEVRPASAKETDATLVLALTVDEGSAKVRTGPPIDDEDDYARPVWAGVVPLTMVAGPPQPDPRLPLDVPVPDHVTDYARPAGFGSGR